MEDLEKMFEECINELPYVIDDNDNQIVPAERRIIFVMSPKKFAEEWYGHFTKKIFDESASGLVKTALRGLLIIPTITGSIDIIKKNKFIDKCYKYPVIWVEEAQKHFKFPPNHPQHNTLYGMCDILPDIYVPLSAFHNYFRQMKYSSFMELCASLGAKEISLEYADIENTSYKIDAASTIPTKLGELGLDASVNGSTNKNMNGQFTINFPEKNKAIKEYYTEWMETEPTWKSMKKMRIENHVESFKVEFNYTYDFGINASLAAKCAGLGFDIGGEFKEMKKIELKYNVLFWDN